MLNTAEWLRARSLLRRYWRATIVVGVFAGLAGGVALGVWGIERRTSTVYDRFAAYEDTATLSVFGCFEGIFSEDVFAEYGGDFDAACGDYDYGDVRDFLATRPEVDAAGRFTIAISQVASADRPDVGWRQPVSVAMDIATSDALGSPIVVAGRLADPGVATEATINEEAAERLGVGIGDQIVVTPYRRDEFELAGEGAAAAGGVRMALDVVGITRRPSDLVRSLSGTSVYEDTSAVLVGPAWWASIDGDAARYGTGLLVEPSPGYTNDDVIDAVRTWAPGREWQFDIGPVLGQDTQETVRDAIELQALSLRLVAALIAVAAVLFAGQAVARQSRGEWSDADALDAIGMTRRSMAVSAAMRATAIAVAAVAVAAFVVIGMSPLGPFGVGRNAEPSPGLDIDAVVLAIGLPLVALVVVAFAMAPVAMRSGSAPSPVIRSTPIVRSLPAPGIAGLAMSRTRRGGRVALGAAVVGVAAGAAVGVAAWTLVDSYGDLRADSARYGSIWDAQVGNVGSQEQQSQAMERLNAIPGISAVGVRSFDGTADNPGFVLFGGEPVIGDRDLATVIAGRAPAAPTEIALGRASMDEGDLEIGDEFVITHPGDPSLQFSLTIVGEVVVNTGFTDRPGVGGLVSSQFVDMVAPDGFSQLFAVWVEPGADRDSTLALLQAAFPTTFLERSTPTQVANLGLVSDQPVIVAFAVALLAGAALTHAVVMSVRRNRRDIGVLRSIGFTRHQVMATVGWHATSLALVGLAIGVPLGVIAGRVAWRLIVDDLGIVSAAAAPLAALVIVAGIVLAVANLAALLPGASAARVRPAAALRTE